MNYKRVCIFAAVLVLLFIIGGYLLSDNVYYRKIVREHQLKTASDVFNWVRGNNPSAITNTKTQPVPYVSPRFNIANRRMLFCDEGCIVMATLDHELGYKTHLVNLLGLDSIAHHTILEVYDNGKWKKYDYFNGIYGESYQTLANFKLLKAEPKAYPTFYNFLVNNNYFIKKAAFFVRGIHE